MLLLAKSTGGSGGGGVQSVVGGKNITIDNTDSKNPIVNSLADRYKTSSTTSNTIVSHGTLTFTVDTDLAYIPNQDIIISFDATNYMTGHVESYNETTGELVAHIAHKTGSGTYSSWLIGLDAIKAELPEWGDISGTLSDQTDLQTALDGKVSKSGDSMTGDLTVGTDVFHVDTSNNRVGIGTDSPNVTQHIYGAETILGVDGVALEVADSTGNALNNGGAMVFTANTTRVAGIKGIKEVETGSRGGLGLYTRDGSDLLERVRINKDGNVGINTTSPAQKLDVNGQAVFGNTATRLTTYSDSTYSGIHNGSSLASDESIYMGNGGIFFLTNTANRMVINGDGDVGIGTNNPKSRLSLIDADSGLTHEKTDGGYFYSTGFLLNNPYLTYYGSSGMSLGYGGITGSSPSVNTMFLSNTGDVEVSNDLTVGSDSMYVDSANGRVGINELSPIAPLHVQQSSNDEGIRLYGYDTNSDKYLQIRINQYGSLQMAGTVSVFNFNTVDPKVADNKGMRFGNDNDYIVGYNSADDSLKIGTGSSTSTSNGVSIENDGKFKVQDLQIDTSTDPETGQVWTATDTDGNGEWATPSGGGGSTFRATMTSNQTVLTSTLSLVDYNNEQIDTNSDYDTSNKRFTPSIAGNYSLFAKIIVFNMPVGSSLELFIRKNGSTYVSQARHIVTSSVRSLTIDVSCLVEANGASDYFDVIAFQGSGVSQTIIGSTYSDFFGFKV